MKRPLFVLGASLFALSAAPASAQAPTPDIAAGKAKAEEVCAACHGANGVSVNATTPNLAGQKMPYLAAQLGDFKAEKRKNAIMNAIATQLSPAEISNVAAYYAGLQGPATGTAVSSMLPNLVKTNVKYPADYKTKYALYTTVNYPERPQVRFLYANDVALKAAKDGKPLPNGSAFAMEVFAPKFDDAKNLVKGADGNLVPDKLIFLATMEMQPGWGKDIPEILRNGDWNYAAFNPDMTPRTAANLAECMACHKPLTKDSYTFSIKRLGDFAQMKK